ncbi:hypothetical protein ANO14919_120780 [Xylariales sp. No.14919]|nr:hypothetical protein ANO14919_120780 [Xylariales sp. No.14919]
MAQPVHPTLNFWRDEWDKVCVQLDAFNSLVRISSDTYNRLGADGRNYFVHQASTILNKHTEFFHDTSNLTRVFLANREDLLSAIPCQLEPWMPNGLPRLFLLPPPQQQMARAVQNSTPGNLNITTPGTLSYTPVGAASDSPGSSRSGSMDHIQYNTPMSDAQSQYTQQTTPASVDHETPVSSIMNSIQPCYPPTPSQGYGTLQTQSASTGSAPMPAPGRDLSAPSGTPVYQYQSYFPISLSEMPMNHAAAMNAAPSSGLKRKSAAQGNPQGQAQEE